MTTAGAVNVATFTSLGALLEGARDVVTDAAVERALARGDLNKKVAALQARQVEFNGRVRADLPKSIYAQALPAVFSIGDTEGAVRDGLRQIATLWVKVNAINPIPPGLEVPLKLREDFTLDFFNAAREVLRTAYKVLSDADVELRLARGKRNQLQGQIYEIMKNYRAKVPTALPVGHPLIETLPALSPPEGRTPDPVVAHAEWDAASGKAKVTWAASTEAELKHYEVRGNPGETYVPGDETLVATVAPNAPREVLTEFSLGTPGLVAGFKVYVVLKTDREKGSKAVFVTRPE